MGVSIDELLTLIETHPGVGQVPISPQRNAPIRISVPDFNTLTKVELIRCMLPAFRSHVTDVRTDLVSQLAPRCDLRAFARWTWESLRDQDVPSLRIHIAVALGQSLRGYRDSNSCDRLHAEYLTQVGLFVTSDRGLGEILGHKALQRWIPTRWAFLDPAKETLQDLIKGISAANSSGDD